VHQLEFVTLMATLTDSRGATEIESPDKSPGTGE